MNEQQCRECGRFDVVTDSDGHCADCAGDCCCTLPCPASLEGQEVMLFQIHWSFSSRYHFMLKSHLPQAVACAARGSLHDQ